jgi:hypothetical protein
MVKIVNCKECKIKKQHMAKGFCKRCYNKWYSDNNKEKIKQYHKQYMIKNKLKLKIYRRKHYLKNKNNPEYVRKSKEYYKKNKNKIRQRQKRYTNNNVDKLKENKKKYYLKNKSKILNKSIKYYYKNKPIILQKRKVYAKKNRLKIKIYQKEYRIENKEQIKLSKKEWYHKNIVYIRNYFKEYRDKNCLNLRHNLQKRRYNKKKKCPSCNKIIRNTSHFCTKCRIGKNHPSWVNGISYEPYGLDWTERLRKKIRKRDNYTCQLCNEKIKGRKIDVHHIDYNKKNNVKENLISLCHPCHIKTNTNRDYWTPYFYNYLAEKHGYKIKIKQIKLIL